MLHWSLRKMGKSDPIIYDEYLCVLRHLNANVSVAFLGFTGENSFTRNVSGEVRHFYDRQLKNWEINSDWCLSQKYDLIVCTRCAYFSREPEKFIDKCKEHLNPGGHALIDWGLGDHWRFPTYKVGWVRHGEHEYAYDETNFVHSCFWNDSLLKDENVRQFWNCVTQGPFGYAGEDIKSVIEKEVPSLVKYETERTVTKFLWPDSPQLYIITLLKNDLRST